MRRQRYAAIAALALAGAVLVLTAVVVIEGFLEGILVFVLLLVALAGAWQGLVRRGAGRLVGFALAALFLAATVVVIALEGRVVENVLILVGAALALAAAEAAFVIHVPLPAAAAPRRPVLFFNPLSGGGKAERFHLADEARARGIEPVELRRGDDLSSLVRGAVARGADGLAMGGGDGSQAIVAAIAAELGLPYACVPAGTRNHLALDLGVDRDDVVGALDAFVDGGERRVDLAEVNGRVFVNNVSLGIYAEAVQRAGYRDAKLRTLLDTVPDALGPGAEGSDLRWRGPGGRADRSAAVILVSNNRYRLGHLVGSGSRPRMDEGVLGITMLEAPRSRDERSQPIEAPWRDWSATTFEVDADGPVPAGIDGEAAMLDPPLRFRVRRGVLRARIARRHPGASPSTGAPDGLVDAIRSLARIAAGRASEPAS